MWSDIEKLCGPVPFFCGLTVGRICGPKDDNRWRKLDTAKLRKFLARRRWKRWFNTIKAINRMVKMSEV